MPRYARLLLIGTAAVIVAHIVDAWAWRHVVNPEVYEHDFGRMLRVAGYLPTWLALAVAVWLQTGERRRGIMLAAIPTVAGLLAEVLKLLLRRERPNLHDGQYVFRAFTDEPFSSKALGLPSSHVLVAFAGVWLLCKLYPRASVVWIALGVGCGLTRVQAHAHFVSDVTVAAVAAYVLVDVVWRRWGMMPAAG